MLQSKMVKKGSKMVKMVKMGFYITMETLAFS